MNRIPILAVACAVLVALAVTNAGAYSSYASATGKVCGYCHVNPKGGGTLTTAGQYYLDNGTLPPSTPASPTTLTATAASSTQINLGWQDNSTDETGFKVERASSPSGPFTEIAAVAAGVTTYNNTGLTASTTYYYRVCASNAAGNSGYTGTASATTPAVASPPAAPTTLTATAASSTQINLGWQDNSTNETGFKVERSSSLSGPFTEIAAVAAGVTTYNNTGLTASTTYYYRVCASNAAGNSGYTGTASAATPAIASPPAAPTTLTATVASSTQINLGWQDNSTDETGFKVERASSPSGPFTEIAAVAAGVTTYNNTGLTASTTYYYRVCASNATGNSGYTGTASATTPAVASPPAAPTTLTATAASSTQINLGWQDNSTDETGFKVERSSSLSGPFTEIAAVAAGVTTYNNTGLTASVTYYYRVCASNAAGNSSYTSTASATTSAAPVAPVAPTSLSARAASSAQINLRWQDNSSDETGFRVERASSSSGPFTEVASASVGATTYSNAGLSASTKYYYRVCAFNDGGSSGYSNTASATTTSTPPSLPTVSAPTFDPDGGTYSSSTSVTINCATDGATIHYTTNGNDPTESDPTIVSGSTLPIDSSITLKARSWKTSWNPSAVKSSDYIISTSLTIDLVAGWNMISVPLIPPGGVWSDWASALDGVTPSLMLTWDAGLLTYASSSNPAPGIGYWVRMTDATSGSIQGTPTGTTFTIDIKGEPGGRWNLIGNPFPTTLVWDVDRIQVSELGGTSGSLSQAFADGCISDHGWSWDGLAYKLICDPRSYDVVDSIDSLYATSGCWLQAFRDCQLILTTD